VLYQTVSFFVITGYATFLRLPAVSLRNGVVAV